MNASAKPRRKPHEGRIGRPTLGEAGAIDEAILAAAAKLLLTKGYDGTSMEAVALAAGVSKRTLYLRYSSKEALMKGVVDDRVASWAAAAGANDHSLPADFKARLIRHAQTLAHALGNREIRDFARLTDSVAMRFPELAKMFYDVGYRYELDFLTEEIRNGTASDAVPARDPQLVARQLLSMIIGWRRTEESVREIDAAEADAFAKNAVEVLFAGRQGW